MIVLVLSTNTEVQMGIIKDTTLCAVLQYSVHCTTVLQYQVLLLGGSTIHGTRVLQYMVRVVHQTGVCSYDLYKGTP